MASPREAALVIELDFDELAEAAAVVVAHRLGVPERLQDLIRLRNRGGKINSTVHGWNSSFDEFPELPAVVVSHRL